MASCFFAVLALVLGINSIRGELSCTSNPSRSLPPHSHVDLSRSPAQAVYRSGEDIYFKCNLDEGYHPQQGSVWYDYAVKCTNGDWVKSYEAANVGCVKSSCGADERVCQSGTCIPSSKWCDCIPDCSDRSDEQSCPPFPIDISHGEKGTIRKLFFENGYPGNIDCTLNISTTPQQTFHLSFQSLSMGGVSGMHCRDYITLDQDRLSYDGRKTVLCLSTQCPFCDEAPPDSTSTGNWATIRFVSKQPASTNTGMLLNWSIARKATTSSTTVAFIIVGCIIGGIILAVVVLVYAYKRYSRSNSNVRHSRFVNM